MKSIIAYLERARKAKRAIAVLTTIQKEVILQKIAEILLSNTDEILKANQLDLDRMDKNDPKYDRLLLNVGRIEALAKSVLDVAKLPDPANQVLSKKKLENGLLVEKRTVALGVVGVIYESRPNVTIDVASLCIQSGNVCLLRGSTDAWNTNLCLVNLIQEVLKDAQTDESIVQLLPTDRDLVQELLTATEYVDIIIPRGSESLIKFVRDHAKVPVIETGAGVCHTYIEESADLLKAAQIVANAKISRPSVCNSLDTVIVDQQVLSDFVKLLIPLFKDAEVGVYADERSFDVLKSEAYPYLYEASSEDFGREYLSLNCSVKVVDSFQEALDHIEQYSSKHSECIVSANQDKINTFMQQVDAAAVYANASTRFTDGGEFGLGAEIGISTQKLHARGPFALEKLVTEKWYVTGEGQIR